MPSSKTVKIVVKLKDKYYLEDDVYKSFNKLKPRLLVSDTIFDKANTTIISTLYGKEESDSNKKAFSNLYASLEQLSKGFNQNLVLESLFSEIDNKYVSNLMYAAWRRGDYKGENLLNSYFIETSEENAWDLLSKIRSIENSGIDYAYIRGEVVESVAKAQTLKQTLKGTTNDKVISAISSMFEKFGALGIQNDGKTNVTIVDVEQGWDFNNEGIRGLRLYEKRILGGGFNHPNRNKVDHGTKTLNVLCGEEETEDSSTLNGLCAGVNVQVASVWFKNGTRVRENREAALASLFGIEVDAQGNLIKSANTSIDKGDIVLLELQTRIPGLSNLLPVEVEPVMYNIIKLGVKAGFIIIEAAGNGSYNLDTPVCSSLNLPLCGYKELSDKKSTGAIMVGALEKTGDIIKMRNDTNFGSRVDCYCFGNNIFTSTGLIFNSTSLASSIIAALAANLQKRAKLNGKILSIDEMKKRMSSRPDAIPEIESHLINPFIPNRTAMGSEKKPSRTGFASNDEEKLSHQGIRESDDLSVESMKDTFKEEFIDKLPGSDDTTTKSGLQTNGYFIGRVLLNRILAENEDAAGIIFSFGLNDTLERGGQLQLIAELASGDGMEDIPVIIGANKKYATGEPGVGGPDGTIPAIKPTPPPKSGGGG